MKTHMTPARVAALLASAANVRTARRIAHGELPAEDGRAIGAEEAGRLPLAERLALLRDYIPYAADRRNSPLFTVAEVREAIGSMLPQTFYPALRDANEMMIEAEGLEPRSALKQAGSDHGIAFGPDMEAFVKWAEDQWGVGS